MEKRFENPVFQYDDAFPVANRRCNYASRVCLVVADVLMLAAYVTSFISAQSALKLAAIMALLLVFSSQMYLLFCFQTSAQELRFTVKRGGASLALLLVAQLFDFRFDVQNVPMLVATALDLLAALICLIILLVFSIRWCTLVGHAR